MHLQVNAEQGKHLQAQEFRLGHAHIGMRHLRGAGLAK
jgi:hypothetical protein